MDDFGKMTLWANQVVNGTVEGHCKSGDAAARHLAGDLNRMFEFKQRKSQLDCLVFGDRAGRVDKHAIGADIPDDIPEGTLSDRILDNNEGGPAGMVPQVWILVVFPDHFVL